MRFTTLTKCRGGKLPYPKQPVWLDGTSMVLACSCDLNGLVGVKPRIKHIEALLLNESLDIRMLGIWGMGGIGKTTLAEAVFSQIKDQFEGCCFLPSVRINCEKDGDYIIKQLLFQISGEKDEYINSVDIRYSTSIARMLNIKALVVVDDVNSTQQLEFFLHNRHVFGRGSRIIVTSRDKHTLSWCCVDDIYEVNGLDFKEAQMFFYQSAFRKNFPAQEHSFLADLFITYANGNPLGLKILGSLLFGKNAREWKSAWDKLQKYPTEGIQNVLKISYDDLDKEERDIFLHLACFFRGERMNEVTKILNACGFNTDIALSVLIDKSLITIIETYSYHSLEMPSCLEMHDLLQEMGKGIVREESREPGKRSRLWDHGEIVRVLKENAGTGAIEAICLDMSKIDKIDLNPYVFKSMSSLKLLKFYDGSEEKAGKVHFPQGLECLPSELRYLYWHGYPLESLPSNFDPAELVELHLPYSMNIKSLQNFEVPQSSRLLKVPMLLGARNLVHINMYGCARIETFPSTIGLKSLETLNLTRCSKLATFPEVSSNVKSLDISYTAIKIVPATLGSLYRLEAFILINCIKLKHLSGSICKLKSLEMLELSGCLSLQHFPEISETMEHLKYLYLDGTAVEKLPSSIENLKNLHWLRLENCRNLIHLPKSLRNSTSLCGINLSGCLKLKKMPLLVSHCRYPDGGFILTSLSELSKQVIGLEATTCYLFRPVADESSLFSIVCLDLSGNRFEMLPSNIKNLYALRDLDISFCDKLRSLPDLPKSLIYLNANACGSLETSGIENLFHCHGDGVIRKFIFTNCLKLYETPWDKCNAGLDWTIELSSAIAIAPGHGVQQLCSARIIIDSGKNSPARNLTYTSMENSIKIPFSKHSNHCSFHDSETDLCLVINFPAYSILEPFKIYGVAKSKSHYLRKSIVIWSERKENLFSVKGSRDASLKIFLSPEDVDGLMLGSKTGVRPLYSCPLQCTRR
ncbi:disease resistance-like protein DSC1 isoform X2 [Mercurialis annua]|uniref:disease resistance-like protein DSC1 isoform X2 n=1 Tax=Mercurialis annua TaxID=3986 RepID=UPI00215F94A5|nr:disease resistance-like protein DSC1 isoform X2 [Mercurialis annua]